MATAGFAGDDTQLSFPLPPKFYYQHFTDENVKNGNQPNPPPVVTGEYAMYGHVFKTDDVIIQPLKTQGIKCLYTEDDKEFDHIVEMKKLNHSILVNYLELIDIIIDSPASPSRQKKIEEIKVLFINLHHLINEFRPHQARETLRVMLHRQKQQTLETAEGLKKNIQKSRALLKSLTASLSSRDNTSDSSLDIKVTVGSTEQKETHEEALKDLQVKLLCDIMDSVS